MFLKMLFRWKKLLSKVDFLHLKHLIVFTIHIHRQRGYRIIFPEFTCVCPKTGYPDFAAIGLYYLPDKLCLELKSWKLYLNAFRMVGTFHETVTWHLFETIKKLLEPKWLLVTGDFYPRGNVDTTVVFEYGNRPDGADLLVGRLEPRFKAAGL